MERDRGGSREPSGSYLLGSAKNAAAQVHITVDKFAKYEIVARILADLQYRGLKKIGFVNNDLF